MCTGEDSGANDSQEDVPGIKISLGEEAGISNISQIIKQLLVGTSETNTKLIHHILVPCSGTRV
jgi:hypothetical protein